MIFGFIDRIKGSFIYNDSSGHRRHKKYFYARDVLMTGYLVLMCELVFFADCCIFVEDSKYYFSSIWGKYLSRF